MLKVIGRYFLRGKYAGGFWFCRGHRLFLFAVELSCYSTKSSAYFGRASGLEKMKEIGRKYALKGLKITPTFFDALEAL